jgi:hypothetical protein
MRTRVPTNLFAVLSLLAFAATAKAEMINIVNADFELPGAETVYWDGAGNITPGVIPGWEPSGQGVLFGSGDSGVEGGDNGSGAWIGYLGSADPSIFNTSGHSIVSGNSYSATFDLRDTYTDANAPTTVEVNLYYFDGTNRITLGAPQSYMIGDNFTSYSLSLTPAQAAAGVGFPIGIEFDNITDVSAGGDSWIGMDNVSLVTVPEPGASALLMVMTLMAGAAARCSRKLRQSAD